jgi:phosphopantetheinyl transferase (holo-ACP synthase)
MRAVVGNDVVDLGDPAIAGHHRREALLSRVCTDEERSRIATGVDFWTTFAAKEAAYKALVKAGHAPGFAHRSIVVQPGACEVRWRDCVLKLSVDHGDGHVHAVAWSVGAGRPTARVARGSDPGRDARALVRQLVGDLVGHPPSALEVVRPPAPGAWDGLGPPHVEHAGRVLDADVSLSHDGPFVAAAVLVGGGEP